VMRWRHERGKWRASEVKSLPSDEIRCCFFVVVWAIYDTPSPDTVGLVLYRSHSS
jgi:hypothetical protein